MLMSILKSIIKIIDGILACKDSEIREKVMSLCSWIASIVENPKFKSGDSKK